MPSTDYDIHERVAQAVKTTVEDLGIEDNGRALPVYVQTLPDEQLVVFPCVLVTFEGEPEEDADGSLEDDEIIYPVRVFIADRTPADMQSKRSTYLGWRKQILDAFRPLVTWDDCPEVYDVRVKYQTVFDPHLPQYQYVVSGVIVKAHTRQGRLKQGEL